MQMQMQMQGLQFHRHIVCACWNSNLVDSSTGVPCAMDDLHSGGNDCGCARRYVDLRGQTELWQRLLAYFDWWSHSELLETSRVVGFDGPPRQLLHSHAQTRCLLKGPTTEPVPSSRGVGPASRFSSPLCSTTRIPSLPVHFRCRAYQNASLPSRCFSNFLHSAFCRFPCCRSYTTPRAMTC